MSDPLKSVWEGSFMLGNVEMKCYVLEDGRRIIDAGSMEALFSQPSEEITSAQIIEFSKWQRGQQ